MAEYSSFTRSLLVVFAAAVLFASGEVRAADASSGRRIDFVKDVQPILKASCVDCHNATKHKAGLRLDNRKDAFKGGDGGESIVPGNVKDSLLITRVLGQGDDPAMPFKKPALPKKQIETLTEWIKQGADWPANADGQVASTQLHWAYVEPVRAALPVLKTPRHTAWCKNAIDRFVMARLEREGLEPAPEASRETLIRRLSLDLIGLPPTPQEVADFVADQLPDAYEKLVDRLLASPHYGERSAIRWLDLARYADSNGYEKDRVRSIWPYRDWVIDAMNADMPFQQFTIEQIAGDLLPDATIQQKIATGFNRNTMINEEGGTDPDEFLYYAEVDRANTTATVWLGTSLGCAQCHNHKFDPFTQKDYYQLLAFFNSTADEGQKIGTSDPHDISVRVEVDPPQLKEVEKQLDELKGKKDAQSLEKAKELKTRVTTVSRFKTSLVMQELPKPRESFIHLRGGFLTLGDKVVPGIPAVFRSAEAAPATEPTDGKLQNRLDLARWLASNDNPLTARVTVNRLWEQHFGRGIVATSEDFGSQGDLPTDQALLDWLAVEFMTPSAESADTTGKAARPWSMKAVNRLIVTSAVYRQASMALPSLLEKDPYNKLLARGPRFRMSAELIRDESLACSGMLCTTLGGPSVFPMQPPGIWHSPYNGEKWPSSTGEDRFRRSVYTFLRRSAPYPQFAAFDKTTHEAICTRRSITDTPLQALTTLNDPAAMQMAAALARRIMREGGASTDERTAWVLKAVLCREPHVDEISRLSAFYEQMLQKYQSDSQAAKELAVSGLEPLPDELPTDSAAAWTMVSNVVLNLDEALTVH